MRYNSVMGDWATRKANFQLESHQQFAAVLSTRRRQIAMRLLLPAIVAPVYAVFTGSFITVMAGVLGYFLLQAIEVWVFPRALIQQRMAHARWRTAALAVVAVNGVIFGSVGIVAAVFGGPWGAACGALWVSGAILNAVLTSVGCRPVFVAALLPQIGYFIVLSLLAMPLGASPGQAAAFAVTAGLNITAALLAWRLYQNTLAAEREAKALAQAATAAKSAFVAMVSHELRTPLSAVLAGAAELEGRSRSACDRLSARLILDSARMMNSLLNDLLDMSKIEAGRLTIEEVPYDLQSLVEDTLKFWSAAARKKGISLQLETGPSLGWARGDPFRLRQILNNLLSNAIKFTDDGAVAVRVLTSTQPHGEFLQVEVTDTGPGIPPRQLERLFNAFEQLEASTARTHGGTGLGLNISRQLAKLMGGDLTVNSLAGDGTTFSLRLPHTRLEGAVERADCEQPVAPSMNLRVLIVDDHEINRKAFSLMLRPFCRRIVTAKDGQGALELLSINEFDVVLMDMNMPVMGGVEAVKRLRGSNGMNRNTPVVALTASSAVDHVDQCRSAGMQAFVNKPVEAHQLFAAIEAVLGSINAEQDIDCPTYPGTGGSGGSSDR
ncbi:MAG: signal transduction histidine kinase/ActR/RegA family two-component response regulator [Pseudoalteromonas distincta]